jgi:hypothetical protein
MIISEKKKDSVQLLLLTTNSVDYIGLWLQQYFTDVVAISFY